MRTRDVQGGEVCPRGTILAYDFSEIRFQKFESYSLTVPIFVWLSVDILEYICHMLKKKCLLVMLARGSRLAVARGKEAVGWELTELN